MGFEVGGGRGGRQKVRPTMNVTPLVDVVLVLLIIFMVITPLLTKQMWMRVPQKEPETKVAEPADAADPVVLSVDKDGTARINSDRVSDLELPGRLARVLAATTDRTLFFDAADDVPYERAIQVMDVARGAGAVTIAVLTEPIQE